MVYFVRHAARGEIKIGYSGNVATRMQYLLRQVGPIEVLAVVPGSMVDERAYHVRFAADRLHGEWFAPSRELLEHIGSLTSCEPIGLISWGDLPDFEFTKEPDDAAALPRWLTVDGGASERGLPLRPPSKKCIDINETP